MSAVAVTALPPALARLQSAQLQLSGEPAVLQTVRHAAMERFIERGLPTIRDEDWKYTSLRRFETQEFALADNSAHCDAPPRLADAHQLVFVDGFYKPEQSSPPQQTGVGITALSELLRFAPERLARELDLKINETCRFAALNAALTRDGLLIDIAPNTALDKPLQLSFVWSSQQRARMAHPRVILRAGAYSSLIVVQEFRGAGESAVFTNTVTTLDLSEGARVEHHLVQEEQAAAFHIGLLHAEIAAHAVLTSHHFNLGAALGRLDLNAFLNGAEAGVELNGLQFASGTQHHDTHTRVGHCVPHTRSSEDYRGIADQRGRVVFNGKVTVHEKAVRTDAQQSSRNLLLSRTAEIDTKPELEIYNDDVKCAHGATVGQLDATALFYMRSRGLAERQARSLLTQAFADAVIARSSIAELRDGIAATVHARFGPQVELP